MEPRLRVSGTTEKAGPDDDRRFWGKYVGFVRDTADPQERGRVRFYCPEVMGDLDTPEQWLDWALPNFEMAGGFDAGNFKVPPSPADFDRNGSSEISNLRQWACWIEFRQGDPRFPIYTGGFHFAPEDLPNFTLKVVNVNSGGDETNRPPTGSVIVRSKTVDAQGELSDGPEAPEPPPQNQAVYPFNRAYKSPSGHVWELDDTPGAERIRLYHRQGTYLEMLPDGSLVTKVVGKRWHYVSADDLRAVQGAVKEIFSSTYKKQVGERSEEIYLSDRFVHVAKGEQRIYKAGLTQTVTGLWAVDAGNFEVSSLQNVKLLAAEVAALAGREVSVVGQDVRMTGATSFDVVSPTGVRLAGLLPPASAQGIVIKPFLLAIRKFMIAMNTAMNTLGNTAAGDDAVAIQGMTKAWATAGQLFLAEATEALVVSVHKATLT